MKIVEDRAAKFARDKRSRVSRRYITDNVNIGIGGGKEFQFKGRFRVKLFEFIVILLELSNELVVERWASVRDGVDFDSRKGVCDYILFPLDVANVRGELRNVVEVMNLAWGIAVLFGVEGTGERLMIGHDMKLSAFQGVAEMSDREVNS